MEGYIEGPPANRQVVKALFERLVAAFEEFAAEMGEDSEKGLIYLDALMGCHNFYKRVILDMEERTGSRMVREVALRTLERALKEKD